MLACMIMWYNGTKQLIEWYTSNMGTIYGSDEIGCGF